MDIWLTICRKTVPKCSYCKEPIKLGEVMIAGRLWLTSKKEGEIRKWVKNFRWHAQRKIYPDYMRTIGAVGPVDPIGEECCWLVAGLDYLSTHPQEETRGRKQLQLPKKQKDERLKILRQRARLVQKLKELMVIPLAEQSEVDTAKMIKIGSQIEELKEQISLLGGVPSSWESSG